MQKVTRGVGKMGWVGKLQRKKMQAEISRVVWDQYVIRVGQGYYGNAGVSEVVELRTRTFSTKTIIY